MTDKSDEYISALFSQNKTTDSARGSNNHHLLFLSIMSHSVEKKKNGKSIIQFSLDISSKSTHEHKRHNIVPSNKDICKIMQLSSNIR